jgi:probable rRNA maturation factor
MMTVAVRDVPSRKWPEATRSGKPHFDGEDMIRSLDVQIATALQDPPTAPSLEAVLDACLEALNAVVSAPQRPGLARAICLRLCDEAESQELNNTYRCLDKPTNVLSFGVIPEDLGLHEVAPEEVPLGDLAICWPVVLTQATEQKKLPMHHLSHLFIHGVLHLLGHDHEDPAEAAGMEALEVRALDIMGIADPYVDTSADRDDDHD